jgi:hypothetical protein
MVFLSLFRQNSGVVTEIRPQLLSSTFFLVNYSSIMVPFGTVQAELLIASLNKSQINGIKQIFADVY